MGLTLGRTSCDWILIEGCVGGTERPGGCRLLGSILVEAVVL